MEYTFDRHIHKCKDTQHLVRLQPARLSKFRRMRDVRELFADNVPDALGHSSDCYDDP